MRSVHAFWLLLLLGTLSQTPSHAHQPASAHPVQDSISDLLHQATELTYSNEQHDDTDTDALFVNPSNRSPSYQPPCSVRGFALQRSANANPTRAPPKVSSLS